MKKYLFTIIILSLIFFSSVNSFAVSVTPTFSNDLGNQPNTLTTATYGLTLLDLKMSLANTYTTAKTWTTYDFEFTAGTAPSSYFSNYTLYRSTQATLNLTNGTATTVTATWSMNSTTPYVQFTDAVSAAASTTTVYYYFIVADCTAPPSTGTFQLNLQYEDYITFNTPTYTGTSTGNVITFAGPASMKITANYGFTLDNPAYFSELGNVLISFGVQTSSGTGTFSSFTLQGTSGGVNTSITSFFSNYKLYSSPNANYTTLTPVTFTVSGTGSAPVINLATAKAISTTPLYYYVVADFTNGASIFSPPNDLTADYQFALTNATGSLTYSTTSNFTYTDITLEPNEYVWIGAGNTAATENWTTPSNWSNYAITTDLLDPGTSASYPGLAASNDIAIIIKATTATINLASAINPILQLQTTNKNTINLNITSSTVTLSTNYLYLGGGGATTPLYNGNGSNAGALGIFTLSGGGVLEITTHAYLYGTTDFNIPAGGNLSLPAGSEIDLGDQVNLNVTGGNFTASNSNVDLYGVAATIDVTGGTFLAGNNSTVLSDGTYALSEFINNGGAITISGGSLFTISYGSIVNTAGTFTVDGSTVDMETSSLGPATNGYDILNNGGTFIFQNGSVLESLTYSINFFTNSSGYVNFLNSNINFSTSYNTVQNTGSGTFTLDPTSSVFFTLGSYNVVNNTSSNPFSLLSSSAGSATIGPMNNATYNNNGMAGNFYVQRFLTGGSSAYRGYRLLSSPVTRNNSVAGSAATVRGYPYTALTGPAASSGTNDVTDISYLGNSETIPVAAPATPTTYHGAYIGGPGFPNVIGNPIIYLYREAIAPGTFAQENSSFTSGKYVGITSITSATSPNWTVATKSTALGYASFPADNATNVVIPAGNAALFYYIGDNTRNTLYPTNPLSSAYPPSNSYLPAYGYINQGLVTLYIWGSTTLSPAPTKSLTYTNNANTINPGITLVGNPYPSSIDLVRVYSDNAGLFGTNGEAFYQLDVTSQQYVSFNGNGTSSYSPMNKYEYIESGQGFFITVPSAGATQSLKFYEDQKVSTLPTVQEEGVRIPTGPTTDHVNRFTNNAQKAKVNLASKSENSSLDNNLKTISGAPDTVRKKVLFVPLPPVSPDTTKAPVLTGLHLKFVVDSADYDGIGVYFNKKWSDKFDSNDSYDLDGQAGKVYLSSYTSDDVRTSINAMGDYAIPGGKRVKLYVKAAAAGIYQLQMADIINFKSANYSVFLLDKMLKDSLDLTLYKSYNFNYTPGTANDSTRFVLAIEHKPVPYYALLTFAGQKITQGVQLDWTVKNEFNTTKFVVQKLGANGAYAFLDSLSSDSSSLYSYVDQHPSLGNNTYRLQQTNSLGVITYSAPVTIGYNSSAPNGGLVIYPNPAKSSITVTLTTSSTASQVATADIYNTSGKLIEHKAVSSNSFTHDVSAYQLGVYIIELKNNNGILVGKSKFVKVN
jgi:hypothetical protein